MGYPRNRRPHPVSTVKFIRKPFAVEAVQVTEQNMRSVSRWCNGQVRNVDAEIFGGKPDDKKIKCIVVPVKRPLSERQTMAQIGDWVVQQGRGHKVYTPHAFAQSFDQEVEEEQETQEDSEESDAVLV